MTVSGANGRSKRRRLGPATFALTLAAFVAIASGLLTWTLRRPPRPSEISDFTQVWAGGRALLSGHDPYQSVGPGTSFSTLPLPLLYPLPAILITLPLSPLPAAIANAMFVGISAGLLAFALARISFPNPRLLALVSAPFFWALLACQWSPLMMAAGLLPSAGWLLMCKPTNAVWWLAAFPRRRVVAGIIGLTVTTIAIWPHWLPEWLAAIRKPNYMVAPVRLSGGVLMLLALIRWRRPEARLLAALACTPHTTLAYEALPVFLIPETWGEGWLVWALSFVAVIGQRMWGNTSYQPLFVASSGRWLIWCLYLPCVALVLRRPNTASFGWQTRKSDSVLLSEPPSQAGSTEQEPWRGSFPKRGIGEDVQ